MMNKLLSKKPPIKFEKLLYILFTVVLVTSLSCSKNEDGINNETISEANLVASKGVGNAPAESGAFVMRFPYEGAVAITLMDKKTNLTATVGWSDLIPGYCGGEGIPAGVATVQEIFVGADGLRIIDLIQGELPVRVYGEYREYYSPDSWCPIFTEAPLLAEGPATVVSTDVYFTEFNEIENWSVNVRGQLMSPENELKQFNARVLYSWRKGGEYATLLDAVISVTIQLN